MKLLLYTILSLNIIAIVFPKEATAQSLVDHAKLEVNQIVVAALCQEEKFTIDGTCNLDSVPNVQEQLLTYYERRKGAKSVNTLRKYFEKADQLFSVEKATPEDLNSYIDKLIETLNENKPDRKKTDFGKHLEKATNDVVKRYSEALEQDAIVESYSTTDTITVNDSIQEIDSSENKRDSNGYILWGIIAIALVVALVALGLTVRAGATLKDEVAKRREGKFEMEKINAQLSEMSKNLKEVKSQLSNHDEGRKELEERVRELSVKQTNSQSAPVGQPSVAASDQTVSAIVEKPAPKVKYAVYADEGNGFSNSALNDAPSSETIFEITLLSESSAEFAVSESSAAQDMARSDIRLYLAETCSYSNSPSTSAFIKTVKRGKLRLNGSKWEIAEKATISFT